MSKFLKSLSFVLLAGATLVACSSNKNIEAGLQYSNTDYSDLIGWENDQHLEALNVFLKSCERLMVQPKTRAMGGNGIAGTIGDWVPLCERALIMDKSNAVAKNFFEKHFTPVAITIGGDGAGLFTGYYEPLLRGSLTKTSRYSVPLYKKPDELIAIDLGQFRPNLKGQNLVGVIKGNRLVPYYSRAEIVDGALNGRNLELIWVDSAIDAFFLQVQGSGRVQLDTGEILGVGYAGKNGHIYRSIGRKLIDEGIMTLEEVSLASLKQWLMDNPNELRRVLDANPSYVFFQMLETGDGPFGSANVALTAERSLAVDPNKLPLNAPMWLETTHPDPAGTVGENISFNRLMIAQDTGGAIKGAIRGDVFWGFGDRAEIIAGRMANQGRYYLLLPKALAARVESR